MPPVWIYCLLRIERQWLKDWNGWQGLTITKSVLKEIGGTFGYYLQVVVLVRPELLRKIVGGQLGQKMGFGF
jgi:hypothetical protein